MNKALIITFTTTLCLLTATITATAKTADPDTIPPTQNTLQTTDMPQQDMIIPPNPRDLYVISQSTAIGIALDHAPPSRDYKVSAYDFKGIPAYSILFYTEDGSYEVIIGAISGRVLDKGYLQ